MPEPAANEVVPVSRTRSRGRQLSYVEAQQSAEEKVSEERLPQNTRFPPRSRNLNTTPTPNQENTETTERHRGRGKPQPAADSAHEESQVRNHHHSFLNTNLLHL